MFELHFGERLMVLFLVLLGASLALALAATQQTIFWPAFLFGFLVSGSALVLGLLLRLWGVWHRVSVTAIAIGAYITFASLLALLNYTLFPLQRPLIDQTLFRIDAALGYDWAVAVGMLAEYPAFARLLSWIYMSSLLQLLVLLVVLGVLGRVQAMHRLIVTGMLASVLTLGFWAVWPSFGPSAYVALTPEVIAAASLLVTPDYGAHLMDLAQNGQAQIGTHKVLGTVAFPSFHIVMACLAAVFAFRTVLFWPSVVINLLMVPATLTHGGHHLIDVIGGVAVFGFALALASRLLVLRFRPGLRAGSARPWPAPATGR